VPNPRVVLDANVLVSGIVYPTGISGRILDAWRRGCLDVVLSRHILDEMIRVLPRLPRLKLTAAEIRDLADSPLFQAAIVEPDSIIEPALRDPADQQVLGTLRVSEADYLITGDKDLLALAGRYSILTPAAFWAKHGE
jgi:putative PIN family toxin of toxin-antitoxin system